MIGREPQNDRERRAEDRSREHLKLLGNEHLIDMNEQIDRTLNELQIKNELNEIPESRRENRKKGN